jgi:cytochrome c peroxidase
VPNLRNVSRQPSLGHDGRWPDLETAVIAILRQREVSLTNPELHQLLTYLELL